MKFLVDAQLPWRIAKLLKDKEYDTIHTLELSAKNQTLDSSVHKYSMEHNRTLITKDPRFLDEFIVLGKPYKLLLITTGSIRNAELVTLFSTHLEKLVEALKRHEVVELSHDSMIVRV